MSTAVTQAARVVNEELVKRERELCLLLVRLAGLGPMEEPSLADSTAVQSFLRADGVPPRLAEKIGLPSPRRHLLPAEFERAVGELRSYQAAVRTAADIRDKLSTMPPGEVLEAKIAEEDARIAAAHADLIERKLSLLSQAAELEKLQENLRATVRNVDSYRYSDAWVFKVIQP